MRFSNVSHAVQRYPMSPPLSPGENEDANKAKMHQPQSERLTPQCASSIGSKRQQHSSHDNGCSNRSRYTWCGGREVTAFEGGVAGSSRWRQYGHNFEYPPAKLTAYYGYHGGWADWQQGQQEWDSSYAPPRPQPRPEQYNRELAYSHHYHRALATPPPESFTAAHCRSGYAQPQMLSTAASAYQQHSLTQEVPFPVPGHNSMSGMHNEGAEDYTSPKTQSRTAALKALKAASNPVPPQRQSQYSQADFPGAIVTGKTVRIRGGAHDNLTGIVKSATKNGATVEIQSVNKTMVLTKKCLDLVDAHVDPTPAPKSRPRVVLSPLASNAMPLHEGYFIGAADVAPPPPEGPAPTADPQTASPSRRSAEPKVYLVAQPQPDYRYLAATCAPTAVMDISRPLLVILDLNGTLLHRKNKGSTFTPRPHLDAFLGYLFSNHVVMVWSSARPQNVIRMCQKFFTPEQFQRVAAIWSRDQLQLSPEAYASNTQVYKQLTWVWQNAAIQATNRVPNAYWDQSNTCLLDDSVEKSASEPFNLIRIDEFENRPDQINEDVLPQVALYLETLRSQRNVSAYIRSQPFVVDPHMPRAASEALAVARRDARDEALYQSEYLER